MRSLLAGAAVLAFFFALNVVAALTILVLGKLLPERLHEEPWAWMAIGLAGVAACLVVARWALRLIGPRPLKGSGRAPAPLRQGATTSPGRSPSSSGS